MTKLPPLNQYDDPQAESKRRCTDHVVVCDACYTDYTERDDEGGALVIAPGAGVIWPIYQVRLDGKLVKLAVDIDPRYAIGPCCAPLLPNLRRVATCPDGTSFADFIRELRRKDRRQRSEFSD